MKNPAYFFLQFPITVLLIVCILLVYEAQVCSANETHILGNLMTALGAILGIAGIFKTRVRQLEKILNESDFDFTGLRAIFWGLTFSIFFITWGMGAMMLDDSGCGSFAWSGRIFVGVFGALIGAWGLFDFLIMIVNLPYVFFSRFFLESKNLEHFLVLLGSILTLLGIYINK